MATKVEFRYVKTSTGELSGPMLLSQTERAINELGNIFVIAEIDAAEALRIAKEAKAESANAINIANSAYTIATGIEAKADLAISIARQADTKADNAISLAKEALEKVEEKAPINHASKDTTYGIGSDTLYGHLKLSDSISDNTSDVNYGTAATPKAVKAVYDFADRPFWN